MESGYPLVLHAIEISVWSIGVIKAETVSLDFIIEWVLIMLEKMEIDIHSMPLENGMPIKFNYESLPADLFAFLQLDFKFPEPATFHSNNV